VFKHYIVDNMTFLVVFFQFVNQSAAVIQSNWNGTSPL